MPTGVVRVLNSFKLSWQLPACLRSSVNPDGAMLRSTVLAKVPGVEVNGAIKVTLMGCAWTATENNNDTATMVDFIFFLSIE
jgi:hypothetical protein